MSVSLLISETLDGAALSDALAGGGTGLDLGSCTDNSYAPIVSKAANTGRQDLFLSHNSVVDPITSLKMYMAVYSGTYGGADSAADNYTDLKGMGNSSGSSKNNADGNSYGYWVDMRAIVTDANQFDKATYPTKVLIFGDSTTDGIDLASAFPIPTDAMVYNNTGTETAASAAVSGKIGKAGDTVLGDAAHIRMRIYLAAAHVEGGIWQNDFVWSFSYTA